MDGPPEDRISRLMATALRGDAAAYEEALKEVVRIITPVVRARIGPTLADDVIQETLITVHRARHTYDPSRPFRPWLFAITHSRIVDGQRRNRRHQVEEPFDEASVAPIEPARPTPDMAPALERLRPEQRRVIRMLKVEGFSVREVAQALGLSAANVKVLAHRGYKALREALARASDAP